MLIFKKFISNKKNKILGLLLLLGISILFISYETVGLHNTKQQNLTAVTQLNIKNSKKAVEQLSSYSKEKLSDEEKKSTDKLLKSTKEDLALEERKLGAIKSKNYNEFYRIDHLINAKLAERIKNSSPNNPSTIGSSAFVKSYDSWYKKVITSGQNFAEALGANASGIGATNYILATLGGLLGLVFLTLLCGDALANEFPNGLRYYHLMKKKKGKIQFQHLFIPVLTLMGGLFAILFIFFVIATAQYGIGSTHFPQFIVGASFQKYAGEMLLWRAIYLFLALLFITTLGQLLSQIIKKPYIPSAVIILILVGYSVLQTQEIMKTIIKWIPLTYLNVNTVFNLSDGTKVWPDSGNFLFGQDSLWIGAMMILVCILVFYLVTHILFKRYIYRKD